MAGRYWKAGGLLESGEGRGMWAEYVVTSARRALPLHESVGLEQGAVVHHQSTDRERSWTLPCCGHKAVVLTAAASSLGQMVNRLGRTEGSRSSMVRREAQADLLKVQGASVVLNSSEPDFDQRLHETCHQTDVHLAFDAVAGQMTRQLRCNAR